MHHLPIQPPERIPTVEDVARIAALDNPVVRNLQITQCYFELSAALRMLTGAGANWCTFATWASKQAGQTIRKEDLARTLEAKLKYGPAAAPLPPGAAGDVVAPSAVEATETIWQVLDPAAPFNRASAAVARGNLKVFAEIAREVARYIAVSQGDDTCDEARIDDFCATLRPGEPPEGQAYLRNAFRCYELARFEMQPAQRAELLLLANIEIGFHEQTRLQPEIVEAMEAPVFDPRQLHDRIVAALLHRESWVARARTFLRRLRGQPLLVDRIADGMLAAVRDEARTLISEQLMAIELPPATRLRLGRDLRAGYPESLRSLTNADLRVLLARIDPTLDSAATSGAGDWGSLDDRLHFIVELFRCYQEWPPLFDAPFSAEQVVALKAGRLPAGRL